MTTENMISLEGIAFGYDKHKPLFVNLRLNLQPGHIYGLLGKNGAGKSSLLRLMAGLLFPHSGRVEVNGYEPKRRSPAFLQDVFFVPEEIYLPSVTVDRYAATLEPFYPRFDESEFLRYLAEFDIPGGNKLTGMSFGQKKKVLIAFALATNTKVLIMDEPTNGLDIPSKSQFRKIVSTALRPDRLMLISTHQVRDLDNLIDHIIIMDDSRIVMQHSLDAVAERLYFGTRPTVENDTQVLYAEPSLRGYDAVTENLEREESRVDLEQLFNAVMKNPGRIREMFG
ncbi:ATP-binding cassette domain-containing protein [Persicitalea sp.]|uniref:ABC transporter ATP-binding protein n=1 Tax=Persicitalea sp. TaxID=3100273 RepID=UPI0035947642